MIDSEFRFQCVTYSNFYWPGGMGDRCVYIDSDQRCNFFVVMPSGTFEKDDNTGSRALRRYISHLSPRVQTIAVDKDGLLESISTAPPEEFYPETIHVSRMPIFKSVPYLTACSTVPISQLVEVDRLAPCVDWVVYSGCPERQMAFKHGLTHRCQAHLWHEMHYLNILPSHRHIVPLDKVVVDDVESRILGMTTPFIRGGNFEGGTERPFKLTWLQQLTDTLDYLHFEVGLAHSDIWPSNLLVDPGTDDLKLFDFGWVCPLNETVFAEEIDRVYWTMYGIVTLDLDLFRTQGVIHPDVNIIKRMDDWPPRRELDCDVAAIRSHLDNWIQKQTERLKADPRAPSSDIKEQKPSDLYRSLDWPGYRGDYLPDSEDGSSEEEGEDGQGKPQGPNMAEMERDRSKSGKGKPDDSSEDAQETETDNVASATGSEKQKFSKKERYFFPWRRPPYAKAYPSEASPPRKKRKLMN
ncbi:hypothetical protein DL769_007516 [Monosporascus sp. CRB-8-3]|nr:hypothetical protein DL769_007516 [Monosporascus sp. CRB-8-3]